jgi:hypothetical protein
MGGVANFRRRHSVGTVYRTVSSACGIDHKPASAYSGLIVYVVAFLVEEKWRRSGEAHLTFMGEEGHV